jgi:hypothetical protein
LLAGSGELFDCFPTCRSLARVSAAYGSAFELREADEVVGEVGEPDLGPGPGDPDGPDDEPQSPLLGGEDVLDGSPHLAEFDVAAGHVPRHRPATRFLVLQLADTTVAGEQPA